MANVGSATKILIVVGLIASKLLVHEALIVFLARDLLSVLGQDDFELFENVIEFLADHHVLEAIGVLHALK